MVVAEQLKTEWQKGLKRVVEVAPSDFVKHVVIEEVGGSMTVKLDVNL